MYNKNKARKILRFTKVYYIELRVNAEKMWSYVDICQGWIYKMMTFVDVYLYMKRERSKRKVGVYRSLTVGELSSKEVM